MDKHVPVHAEAPRVIITIEDPASRPFEARVRNTRTSIRPSVYTRQPILAGVPDAARVWLRNPSHDVRVSMGVGLEEVR